MTATTTRQDNPGSSRTLHRYLAALVGRDSSGLLEVRARRPRGMSQAFYEPGQLHAAAAAITKLAQSTDVYVGCAPRQRRAGDRDAVDRVWVLWADCDTPDAVQRLHAFAPAPAIVVRSGTNTNAHAYWQLHQSVDADDAAAANRRIALALGADTGSVTAATAILRPPGTHNHKHDPPRPVTADRLQLWRRTSLTRLVSELPDPPLAAQPPTTHHGAQQRGAAHDPLLTIQPRVYVAALTGRTPGRDGKIACPFHPDDTPSLHAYNTPERGWACFGRCRTGGSVYDLGALVFGLSTRGRDFIELRARLHHELGITPEGRT